MNIRTELQPVKPDPAQVAELAALADKIVSYMDRRLDYEPLIERYNSQSRQQYTITDFDLMAGSVDSDEFAEDSLFPCPQIHDDVTDAEYEEIFRTARTLEISGVEQHYWATFLEINLRSRSLHDLVYEDHDLTPAQMLAEARDRRPIAL